MTDIALDMDPTSPTFKDLKIVDGDLVLVDGLDGIQQNIMQSLKIFKGEWFMDNSLGLDYFGQILVKNPNQRVIDAIFLNAILSVPGVTAVTAYTFEPNFVTRQLFVTFTVQTTNGIVNYAGAL